MYSNPSKHAKKGFRGPDFEVEAQKESPVSCLKRFVRLDLTCFPNKTINPDGCSNNRCVNVTSLTEMIVVWFLFEKH
jgi:hypothetical protein